MNHLLEILMLAVLLAPALHAEVLEFDPAPSEAAEIWPDFNITRGGGESDRHGSETDKFHETQVKEVGVTFAIFYTTRSYNVTDVRGFDNTWGSSYLTSFDYWGIGTQASVEYRMRPDWRMNFTPRVDIAYGVLNKPRHHTHELETLPFTRNYRGADDAQRLSLNMRFEFAVRWRYLWFVQDFQAFFAWRRTEIRAYDTDYQDDQLGTLDLIKDRKRVDWDAIYLFGAGTGIGFEWFFLDESYRFVTLVLWRPYANLTYRKAGGFTNGLEFVARSSTFELTNQLGIFFEVSVQLYLPIKHEFSSVYFSQFSVGVRFR